MADKIFVAIILILLFTDTDKLVVHKDHTDMYW